MKKPVQTGFFFTNISGDLTPKIMTITIPIRPANLRYLRVKYSFHDVYVLSRQQALGHLLQELLRPKPRFYAPIDTSTLPVLSVQLVKTGQYAHLVHLEDHAVAAFNQFVDEIMRAEFIAHVHALTEYAGLDVNESIYHFIEKYGFQDEELSFEALKRYHSRFRRKSELLSLSA